MEFTDEQLAEIEKLKQEAVKKAVAEKEAELKQKHNEDMAALRVSAKKEKDDAVKKAEENAKLTEEERQRKAFEEKSKAEHEELEQLRFEKKLNARREKLVSAGIPEMFKNDTRLINAEDDKVDEVISAIKTEWETISPKGSNTNTNVKSNSGDETNTDKFKEFRNAGIKRR